MLLGKHPHLMDTESADGAIHNYYERLVYEQLARATDSSQQEANFVADVACVALNRLPPRYVRYDVDMSFFLSPLEYDEMLDKVAEAVNFALDYVEHKNREKQEKNPENLN